MFNGFVREGELRRWAPWGGAALLILAAVALQISMEGVCWDEDFAKVAKINEAAGCFEFWFNRYQTLIGAIAALAAASVAWIGVSRQIAISDRQTAIALLPVLDRRMEYAMKIYLKADKIPKLGEDMSDYATTTFEQANVIRLAHLSGQDIEQSTKAFDILLRGYEVKIIEFYDALEEVSEIQTDELAGPALREAFGRFWFNFWIKSNYHREFFALVKACTMIERDSMPTFLAELERVTSYDIDKLKIIRSAPELSLNDVGRQVGLLRDEHDRIFDRSRN